MVGLCEPSGPKRPHLDALPRVQLRPHIEVERELPVGTGAPPVVRPARVEVDDILDLLAAAVDNPVVPVEGRLVAEERIDARLGRHLRA